MLLRLLQYLLRAVELLLVFEGSACGVCCFLLCCVLLSGFLLCLHQLRLKLCEDELRLDVLTLLLLSQHHHAFASMCVCV